MEKRREIHAADRPPAGKTPSQHPEGLEEGPPDLSAALADVEASVAGILKVVERDRARATDAMTKLEERAADAELGRAEADHERRAAEHRLKATEERTVELEKLVSTGESELIEAQRRTAAAEARAAEAEERSAKAEDAASKRTAEVEGVTRGLIAVIRESAEIRFAADPFGLDETGEAEDESIDAPVDGDEPLDEPRSLKEDVAAAVRSLGEQAEARGDLLATIGTLRAEQQTGAVSLETVTAERDAARAELAAVRGELGVAREDIAELKSEFEEARAEHETASIRICEQADKETALQSRIGCLEFEKKELTGRLEALDRAGGDSAAKASHLAIENAALREEVKKLRVWQKKAGKKLKDAGLI